MLTWGVSDAKGYRISKLEIESGNLGVREATGQKGKLARRTIRLAGHLILFVVARGHGQIFVFFSVASPALSTLTPSPSFQFLCPGSIIIFGPCLWTSYKLALANSSGDSPVC